MNRWRWLGALGASVMLMTALAGTVERSVASPTGWSRATSDNVGVEPVTNIPQACRDAGLTSFAPDHIWVGTAGKDKFNAPGSDTKGWLILGMGGDDDLKGAKGRDCIDGGAGDDHILGRQGDDVLIGGDGNDHLIGGPGKDVLLGGNGTDKCNPNPGPDTTVSCESHTSETDAADEVEDDGEDDGDPVSIPGPQIPLAGGGTPKGTGVDGSEPSLPGGTGAAPTAPAAPSPVATTAPSPTPTTRPPTPTPTPRSARRATEASPAAGSGGGPAAPVADGTPAPAPDTPRRP